LATCASVSTSVRDGDVSISGTIHACDGGEGRIDRRDLPPDALVALLVVLGFLMFVTRRMNWYELKLGGREARSS
jgi:hypothetical protein